MVTEGKTKVKYISRSFPFHPSQSIYPNLARNLSKVHCIDLVQLPLIPSIGADAMPASLEGRKKNIV